MDEAAAAFQAGAALLQDLTWENIELAKEAFERAAATGSVDMLWAVADAYVNTTLELLPTRRWMQQAIAAEWAGCEFEVDPEVFAVIAFADSDPEDPYVSHQELACACRQSAPARRPHRVMPQMARTDLRIIVEELRAAGASWARIGPDRTGDFADSGGVDAP